MVTLCILGCSIRVIAHREAVRLPVRGRGGNRETCASPRNRCLFAAGRLTGLPRASGCDGAVLNHGDPGWSASSNRSCTGRPFPNVDSTRPAPTPDAGCVSIIKRFSRHPVEHRIIRGVVREYHRPMPAAPRHVAIHSASSEVDGAATRHSGSPISPDSGSTSPGRHFGRPSSNALLAGPRAEIRPPSRAELSSSDASTL